MNIVVVGLNHRTAPVEVRELFAIPAGEIAASLSTLVGDGVIRELVILSTCNRVEIYAVCADAVQAERSVRAWLKKRAGANSTGADPFYAHQMPESVRHLYEVCSGLDSMVVGETEILGQVKEAYRVAHESHRTGFALNKVFQNAFSVAKEIRASTRVGMGSVSVGSVAADLAGQIFGDLHHRTVMLVGAGETAETTARAIRSRGSAALMVTNRSYERAAALAAALGGRAVAWEQWPQECVTVDIVISATASPQPIINREILAPVIGRRGGAPLFLVDIAVPRDVERDAGQLSGVYLYDIDDLQVIADQNLAMRQQESAVCKQIIRGHVDQFESWFHAHAVRIAKCPTARQMEKWLLRKPSSEAASV